VRTFESGATRDGERGKNDYEGFLSPLVLRRFGDYMQKHRIQSDGSVRASDNWQKGIPLDAYMKSAWRHLMDWWALHRGYAAVDFDGNAVDIEDALCAIIFNAQGYLHELLLARGVHAVPTPDELEMALDVLARGAYESGLEIGELVEARRCELES